MQEHNIKTFGDLNEKYSTWIIKYFSPTISQELFLVWYTDTDKNDTDQLLTFKSGFIFATDSLAKLKVKVQSALNDLVVFDNLNPWLDSFKDLKVTEHCTYNLTSIINAIDNNNLDIDIIEDFANFINLYDDFINQDYRNYHLQVYLDDELIKKIWNYYYEYIF